MKRRYLFVCLIALLCIFMFTACSDARVTEASKLVSDYYKAADASLVTVMAVQSYGKGYLALTMHTADGNQLALFKIEKGSDGKNSITAVSNGSAAKGGLYSANVLKDSGKTVVYGDLGSVDCRKVNCLFDNGTKATASATKGKGYIAVAQGELKLTDFTLYKGRVVAGSYQDLLKDGGSIVQTGFISEE
jgi:hypothetical protein